MPRKVFISVLGSTDYRECIYYDDEFKSSLTRFIQVAMFEKILKSWGHNDAAYIFLTSGEKGSEKKNWDNNGHIDYQTKEVKESDGLKKTLDDLRYKCKIEPVLLRNGDSEKEIWENFRIIFDCLLDDDEVYFDVTHGFRSLPMLVLVLNNYSKFLKNINVASITYGNYEARNEYNEAPIINLTPLSNLQDWTTAANMFIKTGKTDEICKLVGDEKLSSLNEFISEINECRGVSILNGLAAEKAKSDFEMLQLEHHNFKELLLKVKEKVTSFQKNDILNGFRAVQFCIEHKQIQQGITLLQEFIISYVLKDIQYENWLDENARNTVSGCLSIGNLKSFKPHGNSDDKVKMSTAIAEKVFELNYKKELSDIVYKKLSLGARNDLNHAGIRSNAKITGYFGERLKNYFIETIRILSIPKL